MFSILTGISHFRSNFFILCEITEFLATGRYIHYVLTQPQGRVTTTLLSSWNESPGGLLYDHKLSHSLVVPKSDFSVSGYLLPVEGMKVLLSHGESKAHRLQS